ncbi:DNA polymerase iota/DNA damage inducible protein [Phaffia rhodozyma]|uniref:DNA polymerase eta n=1 Tax=Phaffia rhodozyma TaxID=264483 RepID=A0A0F7SGC7_PHARH|nr:DNA polymerase iota/DNA damage inducible protein [Phaffia rhodozyma]
MENEAYPSDQPVTYRHLLSPQTLGPSNPLRVIAHCDVDAAYAQFEAKRLDLDRSVPIAVQQWSALIAVNYAARAFGITRHENVFEAKKKCPELVCVHVATLKDGDEEPGYHEKPNMNTDKVSLEPYRRESQKIIKLFNREAPSGEVEKASIDEAFLDLTVPIRTVLLEKYPFLCAVPPDSPLGLDTPLPPAPTLKWKERPWGIVPVQTELGKDASDAETHSEAEADKSWADVALWEGGEMLDRMRETIELELGYTTSAGVAHNKVLAKLCSAFKKPRAQTILRTSAVSQFLRPMNFQKIRNLGGKLGEVIAETYGAATVEDLLKIDLGDMRKTLGEDSGWIYNILRGIDYSEVKAKSLPKSMMASKNLRPYLTNMEHGSSWLRVLSVELIGRLKEARELAGLDGGDGAGGVWPRTLVFSWREAGSASKSKQIPFPYHSPLSASGPILTLSIKLLSEVLRPNLRLTSDRKQVQINNLALGFTQLERLETGQRGIQGFFAMPIQETGSRTGEKRRMSNENEEDRSKRPGSGWFQKAPMGYKAHLGAPPSTSSSLASSSSLSTATDPYLSITTPLDSAAVDKIIRPGPSVLADLSHRSTLSSSSSSYSFPSVPRPSTKPISASASDPGSSCSLSCSFWVCPECKGRISLAREIMIDFDPEDEARESERIKSEHADWHVALKLQAEFEGNLPHQNGTDVGKDEKSIIEREGTGFGRMGPKGLPKVVTASSDPDMSKRKSGEVSKPSRKGSGDHDRSSTGSEIRGKGGLGKWLIKK